MSSLTPCLATNKTLRARQLKWRYLVILKAVMSTVHFPDASQNDSKQRKADWHAQLKEESGRPLSELMAENVEPNNRSVLDVWKSRSGRRFAEQSAVGTLKFRLIKDFLSAVDSYRISGNLNNVKKMKCKIGLFNKFMTI